MRKISIILLFFIILNLLSACSPDQLKSMVIKKPVENELISANRIVFTNNKEKALKFTVTDPGVIPQIAAVLSSRKEVSSIPDVESDYTITFYLASGGQRIFQYWMGASEYGKEVNLKGEGDVYYNIPESLDVYILSSTKMDLRPDYFVDLYTEVLSRCISMLEKNINGDTIVGLDVKSDRRMRRYTMSYEEEKLFGGTLAEGYKIEPWNEKGNYTYEVSFVTNMYQPNKARITVEVIKMPDQVKKSFAVDAVLENDRTWVIDGPKVVE